MVLFNVPEMCLNVVHYFVEPYVMAFNTSMHDTNGTSSCSNPNFDPYLSSLSLFRS